jgi:hypothetical protein
MIEIILTLSAAFNVLFVFYARWLINIMRTTEEDVSNVGHIITSYVAHVDALHEMDMFYGDPTLEALIKHGKEITARIKNLDFIVVDPNEPEMDEDPAEEEEQEK